MLHGIQVPDSVSLIVQVDNGLVQVIGQVLLKDLVNLSFGIFEDDIRIGIYCLDISLVGIQLLPDRVAAVEDNHLRLADHLSQKGTHIGVIHGKRRTVNCGNLLFYVPVPGKLCIFVIPHTVILYNDTFRLVALLQSRQICRIEILFPLNQLHLRAAFFQKCGIVFVFPFLAEDQQSLAPDLKIVLGQSKADKFRLPALQKTVNHIYRFHLYPAFPIRVLKAKFYSRPPEFTNLLIANI